MLAPPASDAQPLAVSESQVEAFTAAVRSGNLKALRAVVDERVLQLVGKTDFLRSTPENLLAAVHGCRLLRADRVPGNNGVFFEFACSGRPRVGIEEEEDPGVMMKLWPHPSGIGLAVYYLEGGVQVRPRTKPIAPPAPPAPPGSR